jgi:hypothetical protein
MSITRIERKRIAKKIARRKAFIKQRNLGLNKRKPLARDASLPGVNPLAQGPDIIAQYEKMKANDEKSRQGGKWGAGIAGMFRNMFKGRPKGTV